MTTTPVRVLALVACDLCQKTVVPPHAEHQGNGCDFYRTFTPFAELRRQGYGMRPGVTMSGAEWEFKDSSVLDQNVDVLALWFDAVILPRLSWADHRIGERYVNALHRAGLAVIAETDDDLYSPEITRRIKQTVEPDAPLDVLERKRLDRLAALCLADGVTCSSRRLATVLRSLVDVPVCVVPNAMDLRLWQRARKQAKRVIPPLTIGWAGGTRPDADIEPMVRAWSQVAQRHPDVTFVVYGHQPDLIGRYLPDHRVRRIPWHPLGSYALPFANIDIGCAAVADDPFSRCKTSIKVWEYTLGGAAVVATPTLYSQTIDSGTDGLLAETADEWETALERLVTEPETRRRLRRAQRTRIAQEHSLERECWRWPLAWQSIVADFHERRRAPIRPRLVAV